MTDFGNLKRVNLREVWPNEASNFTPWLAEHIGALGEALGIDLELTETEADVGDFSLDLLAKDLGSGRNVIVENQLTQSDHDHLGKLLTYAAAYDASAVVWVAEIIRDEHRQALEWLNQRSGSDVGFFAVVIEVIRIDNSKPAYNFKPVVFPNEWQRESISGSKGVSSRGEAYRAFFQALVDDLRENHKFTATRVAMPRNWHAFTSGVRGIRYSVAFKKGGAQLGVELYIDVGDGTANNKIFDSLFEKRATIESAFGEPLEWERLDERRACRIVFYFPGSIDSSSEELAALHKKAIEKLLKLKKTFASYLAEIS